MESERSEFDAMNARLYALRLRILRLFYARLSLFLSTVNFRHTL